MKSISDQFGIDANVIHLTHPTFFSQITNETAKTVHDEYWHPHVDKVIHNNNFSYLVVNKLLLTIYNPFRRKPIAPSITLVYCI